MICPKCGSNIVRVYGVRSEGNTVRRNRKCVSCGFRFNTKEIYTGEVKRR